MKKTNESEQSRRTAFIVSVAVFVLVIIACLIYLKECTPFLDGGKDIPTPDTSGESLTSDAGTTADTGDNTPETQLPENPVDFSKQMAINDEIYAWLYIPNTNVNYPILQSSVDDLYYMRRGVDKNYLLGGVLFTQSHNKKDFRDPVTVIYGHNMTEDGSMFATLHNFEDAEFFENNEDAFIYTPGHILKYRIISAFKYDARHIMNTFNFDDPAEVEKFFSDVMHPAMIPQNVREGVSLTADDKVAVFCTCMANNTYRYLVCAVLVNDEITK